MSRTDALFSRAAGALWGLALGDALGMPTQLLSRAEIVSRYGTIRRFEAPASDHPIAAGLAPGTVTDDTAQAVLLGSLLQPGAHLDQSAWAEALQQWADRMRAAGSHDLLGPSTTAALRGLRAGVPPSEAGAHGVTNGAAMRITPVGIAVPSDDLERLVDRVVEASMLTHHTSIALAAAAAVAAAVSAGLDGASGRGQLATAIRAADMAAGRGRWVAGGSVARRIEWAVRAVHRRSGSAVLEVVADLVGTSLASQESVPAAFALVAAFSVDPWQVVCQAASVGGDCDTIAAMAGAICGARHGIAGFPREHIETLRAVNDLGLDDLAGRLVEIRCGFS